MCGQEGGRHKVALARQCCSFPLWDAGSQREGWEAKGSPAVETGCWVGSSQVVDREQAGGCALAVGISEGVKWKGTARHWDGKNRKDLKKREETGTEQREERGWGGCNSGGCDTQL